MPSLLIGAISVTFAVGFRSFLPLPFAVGGLGFAAWAAIAGYKVMKANGEWSRRVLVPGLVGLSALALIFGLTISALEVDRAAGRESPAGTACPSGRTLGRRFVKGLRFTGGMVALLSLIGTVRADIPPPPPPPPTIPGTTVTMPEVLPIVLTGMLLSTAIVVIGLVILGKRGEAGKRSRIWVVVPATLVSFVTAGVAVWAAFEHAAHTAEAARVRANWRPRGPVPPPIREPVPPPAIDPPVEKSQSPESGPIGTDK